MIDKVEIKFTESNWYLNLILITKKRNFHILFFIKRKPLSDGY